LSGHTDATIYSQGDRSYSNWELSSDRANASRRELVAGGMEDTKVLRVMGVSSSINLDQKDPYAAINRRISIVVLNRQAQHDIETANSAGRVSEPTGSSNETTTPKATKLSVASNTNQSR
jgi:chemotaxis protein MotB